VKGPPICGLDICLLVSDLIKFGFRIGTLSFACGYMGPPDL